jgi:peptide/nickel transport system substrate-binding protein
VWPCRNDSHLIDLPARQHPAAPGPKPAARDAHVTATSNYITAVRKVHHLMEPKTYRPSVLKRRASATLAAAAASAALIAALIAPAASSAKVTAHPASGTPLIFESSPEVGFTPANYNPYVQSTPAYQAGADSLIYEPLMDFNLANPSAKPYYMLATAYKWGKGGKSIIFTIRSGVKFSDGSAMTPADVAFSFDLLKQYADVNTAGLAITGTSVSGNDVTVTFSSPQYTNLQAIGNTYIVPQSVWSSVGDPGTYVDSSPVGTGPYTVSSTGSAGITLASNPKYWGGAPAVSEIEIPAIASNTTVLSLLTSNQLTWAGNFITGLKGAFEKPAPSTHQVWFAAVQTNSLEPNLTKWPTNQLAVRQAISDAISRTAISTQGEAGLEPVATNASGLVLPGFKALLAPAVKSDKLSPVSQTAKAIAVLKAAGYKIKHGYFYLGTKEVTVPVTDPAAYTDYAEDDALIAAELRKAHINSTFYGPSPSTWAANVASGNFVLTQHWSQTTISAYQLYDYWLNSALITKNSAGNFERLKDPAINADLKKLAGQTTVKGQLKYLAPIEDYVAQNLPVIPTVYGAAFDEYNSSNFSGWPSASNPYEVGQPGSPENEIVVLHLKPKS